MSQPETAPSQPEARRISVSLISDQTLPNLLVLSSFPGLDFHVLVSSPAMQKKGADKALIVASGIPQELFRIILVDENNLLDIRFKLDRLMSELETGPRDSFVVNITGGTKIMSLAVFNYFSGLPSQIVYVPAGKNAYAEIHPRSIPETAIETRVSLKQYLDCYQVDMGSQGGDYALDEEFTQAFFHKFIAFDEAQKRLLNDFRKFRKLPENKKLTHDGVAIVKKHLKIQDEEAKAWLKRVASFLQEIEWPGDFPLSKNQLRYLSGDWFEEWVAQRVRNHMKLAPSHILRSLHVQKNDAPNELDVAFTHANKLYIVECKTSIYDPESGRNLLDEALYKANSIRKDLGLFAQSYFFTLSQKGEGKDMVKPHHELRAKAMGLTLLALDEVKELEKHLPKPEKA